MWPDARPDVQSSSMADEPAGASPEPDGADQFPDASLDRADRVLARPATLIDRRVITVAAPPEVTFAAVERIGGQFGWPYADPLWRIRGWIDRIVGGAGMRGRFSADGLEEGHPLDFWHVERLERPWRLRLRSEMRIPGSAWLEFVVEPDRLPDEERTRRSPTGSRLIQTAIFHPTGIAGRAYWYGLYPIHVLIFRGMVRRLAQRAVAGNRAA
jgi:hypothetical protein